MGPKSDMNAGAGLADGNSVIQEVHESRRPALTRLVHGHRMRALQDGGDSLASSNPATQASASRSLVAIMRCSSSPSRSMLDGASLGPLTIACLAADQGKDHWLKVAERLGRSCRWNQRSCLAPVLTAQRPSPAGILVLSCSSEFLCPTSRPERRR